MRKKRNAAERLAAQSALIAGNPAEHRGSWRDAFGGAERLYIEIGCGKGSFICEMAAANPRSAFAAIEQERNVLVTAAERAAAGNLTNIRFICEDARMLCDMFDDGEADCIYLNFSDPWDKRGQAERRLTHRNFIELYRRVLKDGAFLCFKTDNAGLFDFSVKSFDASPFDLIDVIRDLYADPLLADNVATEYERAFVAKGSPIHRFVAINRRSL